MVGVMLAPLADRFVEEAVVLVLEGVGVVAGVVCVNVVPLHVQVEPLASSATGAPFNI